MLNAVDRGDSLLVVAPTSAGKTFVSYYAMKQVLESNRKQLTGRVVFLVPTRALALQTMGDLYLRYKHFIGMQKVVEPLFATWTRDFRDEGYQRAQVWLPPPGLGRAESSGNQKVVAMLLRHR
jgi:ATP-dependent RNA helicase DDX60